MKYKDIKDQLREGITVRFIHASDHCSYGEGREGKVELKKFGWWFKGCTHFFSDNDEIEILTNPDGSPWRGVGTSSSPTQCGQTDCVSCSPNPYPVSERSESSGRQFQVGDRVQGKPEVIGKVINFDSDLVTVKDERHGTTYLYKQEDLQLIEPALGKMQFWDSSSGTFKTGRVIYQSSTASGSAKGTTQGQSLIKKKSMLDTAIQSLKAKLSKTDRSLVRAGYLNSDGTRTSAYEEQLKQLVLEDLINEKDSAEFRKELAAELKNCDE